MRRRRSLLCFVTVVAASACLAPTATAAKVDPQVAGLQVALRAYKVYAGPIDGISGPATRRGVKRFQQRVRLPVDGVAGLACIALRPVARVVPAVGMVGLVAAVWVGLHAYEIIWWREARAETRGLRQPASAG